MQVAFVHYHVKRGGVTRVMENAFSALSSCVRNFDGIVLCGGLIPDECELPVRLVDGLGYASESERVDPKILADRMEESAKAFFGSSPDVWHIHNHSLGKNPSLVDAILELANRGNRMVLQIHDFAEDGRPENYRLRENSREVKGCYPVSDHIQYVVLNRRDYDILKEAGVPEKHLHWVPNPVIIPDLNYDEFESYEHSLDELIVYPVRAVRRKNLGEMLLHACLPAKRRSYVTTLGTTSEAFVSEYEQWKDFTHEMGLHVTFEVCQDLGFSFDTLIDQSHGILTTSVAEGFGLGFIEPWVFGKSLMGRDLPEITDDFRELGVQFNRLYRSIDIPISVFRFDEFQLRLRNMVTDYHRKYGIECDDYWLDRWVIASVIEQKIDFAKLDEIAQREVIESVQSNFELQSNISNAIDLSTEGSSVIDQNASIVEMELNINKYGERLKTIYEQLLDEKTDSSILFADDASVLSFFFSVERFLPLRS